MLKSLRGGRRSAAIANTDEDEVLLENIERSSNEDAGGVLNNDEERNPKTTRTTGQRHSRRSFAHLASGRARTAMFSAAISLFVVVLLLSAAELLHTVASPSQKIDPCTNFRDYVCAGWDSRNELRDGQSQISRRSTLSEQTQSVLRQIIESSGPHFSHQSDGDFAAEKRIFAKLKKAYVSCMDEGALEGRGLTPVIDIATRVRRILRRSGNSLALHPMGLISSPAPNIDGRDQPSFTEVVKFLMNQGVDALITFRTKIDDEDPGTNSLLLRPVYRQSLLSRDENKNDHLLREYKSVMAEVLSQVFADADFEVSPSEVRALDIPERGENSSMLEGLVQSVVTFETRLTDALPPLSTWYDVKEYYNVYSLEEAESLVPPISLRELIINQTGGTAPKKVIITAPAYLETLSKALRETDRSVLEAYFIWRVVQTHARTVKAKAVEPILAFQSQLEGRTYKPDEERWRLCVQHVNAGLGWILGYFWAKWHLPSDIQSFGSSVIHTILDGYLEQQQSLEWLSQHAKDIASEKLRNVAREIAYPTKNPDLRRPDRVEERYSKLEISEDDYFQNVIVFAQAKNHDRFAKLAKTSDDREWDRKIDTVDAYFSPAGNEIVVPGGIMQPPVYYGPRLPSYLTYGAFGALMGHEISHGKAPIRSCFVSSIDQPAFDSMGRYFDANGNKTDWWDPQTSAQYAQRSRCFIDQYNEFGAAGPDGGLLFVDGAQTLDENLADDRGLRAAFQAWRTRDKKDPDKKIVGLDRFSKEQIFFLSYGSFWCSKSQAETMQKYLRSNVHAPDFARIMGTTANSPDFRSAFGCATTKPTCTM
ncbi:MAG: hypothetical protein L6R36_000543 [Xanthoria steineri]|nr:MAG: hypothetical protein L6R36_000543 [Xanthoria steineri]